MTSPLTLTAIFKTQYEVTFNPSSGGTTSPSGTAWYDGANQTSISAKANQFYQFASWATTGGITLDSPAFVFATATINGPGTITASFQSTLIPITITSNSPDVSNIIVDGQTYSFQTFQWIKGEKHTIEATSTLSTGFGVRYSFNGWSNGASREQIFIVPSSSQTLTVNYNAQYYLAVNSKAGTTSGSDWYDSGANATFSVDSSIVNGASGTRFCFDKWSGQGTGSYSGTSLSSIVTMNGPINETIDWFTQRQLTLSYTIIGGGTYGSAPTFSGSQLGVFTPQVLTTSPTGYWFDEGSWNITNPLSASKSNERWQTNQPSSGTISTPTTIPFNYYHQFLMTLSYVIVGGGSPSAPALASTQFGSAYTPTLTSTPTGYWIDSGAMLGDTNPLSGSSNSQRWSTNQITGTITSTQAITFTYYMQYSYTLSYSAGGAGYSAPVLSSRQYGSTYAPQLSTSGTQYWLDARAILVDLESTRWFRSVTAMGNKSRKRYRQFIFANNHGWFLYIFLLYSEFG